MATLYIIRGASGSGKTTLARRLADKLFAPYYEADMWMRDTIGNYAFDPARLPECHANCQAAVADILSQGRDCIVSNTSIKLWEVDKYIDLADKYGATLVIIKCTGEFENTHGVPAERVRAMRENYETDPNEVLAHEFCRYVFGI